MEHTVEPELLSPIPRRTRPRNRSILIGTILYRFAIVLLIGLGFVMFVYFCLQLSLGTSKPLVGRITEIKLPSTESVSDTDGVSGAATDARNAISPRVPTLEYSFTVNQRVIEDSTPIMPEQIKLLPPGDTIRVRCLPFLYELGHRPILPNDTFWGWVTILGAVTLVTNGMIGTLCWFAFVPPRTQYKLCRYGRTAVGTIIRKEVWGSGANTYIVHYRFEPDKDRPVEGETERSKSQLNESPDIGGATEETEPGAEVIGHMRVPKEFWEKIDAGDRLTVLYSPKNSEINSLYLPGLYMVAPPTYAVVKVRDDARVNR